MMRARFPTTACILTTLCVFFALAIVGCNPFAPEEKPPDKPPVFDERPRTSVENIIYNIEGAYVNRRLDVYERQFEVNDFIFSYTYKDPTGADRDTSWGWTEEHRIHENMFENEDHPNYPDDIRLKLTVETLIFYPELDSLWECTCSVDLKVQIEEITYWANQDSRFWIGDDEREGNEGLFLVRQWEDVSEGTPKTKPLGGDDKNSWAEVKKLLIE